MNLRSIVSIFLVLLIGLQIIIPIHSGAVNTDQTASNWTYEKAEHLARRALIAPTKTKITSLYEAGSARSAVDILFPDALGGDRTQYNALYDQFTGSGWRSYVSAGGVNYSDPSHMNRLYHFRYVHDPYEAKMKLFMVFEDIFSVNRASDISSKDIMSLHALIYDRMLGGYKTLVQRVLYNNPTEKGDYPVSAFLNLLNTSKDAPNENYARELLQLILMDEYVPNHPKNNEEERNYSEDDVYQLSLILTGFGSQGYNGYPSDQVPDEETVYYTGARHNRTRDGILLPGNTGSTQFPFYNAETDTLSLTGIEQSIQGNNGLGDNVVDYIFAKRSHAIALFLANKFFRFYIHENPSNADLEGIAQELLRNNFNTLETVKWMLAQDMMYSDVAMNAVLYKNPVELSLGLIRTLHESDPTIIDSNLYRLSTLLANLGWTPQVPGSIFGRPGFDTNIKWYSGYTHTQWMTMASRIFYDYTSTGAYRMDTIIPVTTRNGGDISIQDFITQAEDSLLAGRRLPEDVQRKIEDYLTTSETGATIPFLPNLESYRRVKFPGVFSLMVSQPEYVLKSGVDMPEIPQSSEKSSLQTSSGKLIIIELPGGYDWLHGVIRKTDYPYYQYIRSTDSGSIAIARENLVDIGDYYLNPYLAYSGGKIENGPAFKDLIDAGSLKIFDRVGTPAHSRNHDEAQQKMASIDNSAKNAAGIGIIGALTAYEPDPMSTIVLGGGRPFIYQGGNYINIGSNDSRIVNPNPIGRLNGRQVTQHVQLLTNTLSGRLYPAQTRANFEAALKLNNAVNLAVSKGGNSGVGFTMKTQLQFAKTMLENDIGSIFYLANGGNGWDTHEAQVGARNIDGGLGYMATTLSDFFRQVQSMRDVTVVVYSEFGRTSQVNGTLGTDHGEGGGMFVLTTNPTLRDTWQGKTVFGNSNLLWERGNWLSPGIDYRTIYGKILSTLYRVPEKGFFAAYEREYADDFSDDTPQFSLARLEYTNAGVNNIDVSVRYQVGGKNFDPSKGSYSAGWYLSGAEYIGYALPLGMAYTGSRQKLSTNYRNIARSLDGTYTMNPSKNGHGKVFATGSQYSYVIRAIDDQFHTSELSGSVIVPRTVISGRYDAYTGSNSMFLSYPNIVVTGSTLLPNGGIILARTQSGVISYSRGDSITMRTMTGNTRITHVSASTGSLRWGGAFLVGESVDATSFLSPRARLVDMNASLSQFQVEKIVRIGADRLGVGMTLNQPVEIEIAGMQSGKNYMIISSEDGINWSQHEVPMQLANMSGSVIFPTTHFSYFALVETSDQPLCSFEVNTPVIRNGGEVMLSWSTFRSGSGVMIDQGIGSIAASGSIQVRPPMDTTTIYTLTALQGIKSASCQVRVESLPLPTCTLASSAASVKIRNPITLSWTGVASTQARLYPIGGLLPPTGSTRVSPTAESTLYQVEVSNPVGTGSCTTTVTTYPNQPPVASFDTFTVEAGTATGLAVLTNDMDPNREDSIVIADIVTPPTRGMIQSITGNLVEYSAPAGLCGGSDAFMYRVKDSDGALSNATSVNILIACSQSGSTASGTTNSGSTDSGSGSSNSGSTDSGSGTTGSGGAHTGSTDSGSGSNNTASGATNSGSTDSGSGTTGSGGTASGSTHSGTTNSGGTASGNTNSGGVIDNTQTGVYFTGSLVVDAFQRSEMNGLLDILPENIARIGSMIELRNTQIMLSHSGNGASLSLSGNIAFVVEGNLWSGVLLAPHKLDPTLESNISATDPGILLPTGSEVSQGVFRTYLHMILGTYQIGAPDSSLALSGGLATIRLLLPSESIGHTVTIFRSEDGIYWNSNNPTEHCIVQSDNSCSFTTDHFSYFGLIDSIAVDVGNSLGTVSPVVGPGGPSFYSMPMIRPFARIEETEDSLGANVKISSGVVLLTASGGTGIFLPGEMEILQELQKIQERPALRIARKLFSRTLHEYHESKDRSKRLGEIRDILALQARARQDASIQEVGDLIEALWNNYQTQIVRIVPLSESVIESSKMPGETFIPQQSEKRFIKVIHTVYLRQQKGQGKILDVLYRDSQVTVEYITGKFAMIRTAEGISGWLHRSFLK